MICVNHVLLMSIIVACAIGPSVNKTPMIKLNCLKIIKINDIFIFFKIQYLPQLRSKNYEITSKISTHQRLSKNIKSL